MAPKKSAAGGGGKKEGPKPKELAALINEGVRWQKDGDFSKARSAFEAALSLKPGYADANYNLAVLMLEEVEASADDRDHDDVSFMDEVRAALRMLRDIISADTSGRGETSGMAHRTIGKTILEYLRFLSEPQDGVAVSSKRAQDEQLRLAQDHMDKARIILQNSAELDAIILEYANLCKVQMSLFFASNECSGLPSRANAVFRSNVMLNRALDLLLAVSRSVEEALQTPYSSGIDLDCYRLQAEALEDFWDWFLAPSSIELLERIMGPTEAERVSRIALDCSCRVALALTEMTAEDDVEFLSHRGDLYQAILRWHRSLRVRAGNGSNSIATALAASTTTTVTALAPGGGSSSSSSSSSSSGSSCGSSSCGSSSIESLCSSLLRSRLEAVLTRNAFTARAMVDLADATAFLVSEAAFMPELWSAFLPQDPLSTGAPPSSSHGTGGSGTGAGGDSPPNRKRELMSTAYGCITVALQLLNTMAKTAAAAREGGFREGGAGSGSGTGGALSSLARSKLGPSGVGISDGGAHQLPPLSFATTPDPATLLLKIARRCYETAISLWKSGKMSREEYLDFDFDVAYYNLSCVCWRLRDEEGCRQGEFRSLAIDI